MSTVDLIIVALIPFSMMILPALVSLLNGRRPPPAPAPPVTLAPVPSPPVATSFGPAHLDALHAELADAVRSAEGFTKAALAAVGPTTAEHYTSLASKAWKRSREIAELVDRCSAENDDAPPDGLSLVH